MRGVVGARADQGPDSGKGHSLVSEVAQLSRENYSTLKGFCTFVIDFVVIVRYRLIIATVGLVLNICSGPPTCEYLDA